MMRPGRWTTQHAVLIALLAVAALVVSACGGGDGNGYGTSESPVDAPVAVTRSELSEAGLAGEKLFIANCSRCHGKKASGTAQGPPLVHQIYEPGHHSDASFVIAVARGVRQHHWQFGNMPAVSRLSIDETHRVICFVRELQLANDIIDEVPTSTPC